MSPDSARATTMSPSPEYSTRSGDTISTCSGTTATSAFLELLGLGEHALHATDVEERLLRHVVELALVERLEALDGLLDRHVDAGKAGEDLADEERLREEPLDLAGPGHDDLVLLGELVETEDGDDVLELLVPLQDLLRAAGHPVVLLAHDLGREDVRRRRERVD